MLEIISLDVYARVTLVHQQGSNPPQWTFREGVAGSGIAEVERAIVFRRKPIEQIVPRVAEAVELDDTYSVYFNDMAQGPYRGTVVQCEPFIWLPEPINITPFGSTVGPFTVLVTGS